MGQLPIERLITSLYGLLHMLEWITFDQNLQNVKQQNLRQFTNVHGVEWNFFPPIAPHMGGCWERLLRSVKTILLKTLKTEKSIE